MINGKILEHKYIDFQNASLDILEIGVTKRVRDIV